MQAVFAAVLSFGYGAIGGHAIPTLNRSVSSRRTLTTLEGIMRGGLSPVQRRKKGKTGQSWGKG